MKANYKHGKPREGTETSYERLNREQKRNFIKRAKPVIHRIVELEKAAAAGDESAKNEIYKITDNFDMVGLMLIEEYIMSKGLLKNNLTN